MTRIKQLCIFLIFNLLFSCSYQNEGKINNLIGETAILNEVNKVIVVPENSLCRKCVNLSISKYESITKDTRIIFATDQNSTKIPKEYFSIDIRSYSKNVKHFDRPAEFIRVGKEFQFHSYLDPEDLIQVLTNPR